MKSTSEKQIKYKIVDRIVLGVGFFFTIVLCNQTSTKFIWTVYFYMVAWQASFKLRESLNSFLSSILCLLILIFVLWTTAKILIKIFPENLAYGKPFFGRLGGTGKKIMFKIDEAHKHINVKLSDDDLRFNRKYREEYKETFKNALEAKYHEKDKDSIMGITPSMLDCALENKTWEDRWEEILETPLKTMRFKDIFGDKFVEFQIAKLYFNRSGRYIDGLFAFFNLPILYVVYAFVNTKLELVNLIRYEVVIGTCAAMIWTIVGLHKFQKMHVTSQPHLFFSLTDLKFGNDFYRIVRHYELKRIFLFYAIYLPVYLFATGTPLLFIMLFNGPLTPSLIQWHITYLIHIIIGNIIMAVSFYVLSILIHNIKALIKTLIIILLASFLLPPIYDFLVTGELKPYDQIVDIELLTKAIVGGLLVFIANRIVGQFKTDKS